MLYIMLYITYILYTYNIHDLKLSPNLEYLFLARLKIITKPFQLGKKIRGLGT